MAHMPLPLVSLATVMLIFHLFIKSNCEPTEFLQLLSVRNNNIVIFENGTIFSTSTAPSLYSLIRMQFMFGTSYAGEHNFSLEAVATRYHICMNRTGKLYTQPTIEYRREKRRFRKKRRNRNETDLRKRKGRKLEKMRPRRKNLNECIFKLHKLPLNESYYKDVIYSAAYSTDTEGRFIAFGKDGRPRNIKKPFANLARNVRLGMIIEIYLPRNIERLTQNTVFVKSKKQNTKIRQCIINHHRKSDIFSPNNSRYNKVSQVIGKCRRNYDPSFRSQWINSCTFNETSLQRNQTFS